MLRSTAAFLMRASLLVVWLQLNVSCFRLVRAREGHEACLRQGVLDADPSLVRYVQLVAWRRLPGIWPLDSSLSVGLIPMLLWSTLVVSLSAASSSRSHVAVRLCLRIVAMTCGVSSANVQRRPSSSRAVVTQLVTRPRSLLLGLEVLDLNHRCRTSRGHRGEGGCDRISALCHPGRRRLAAIFRAMSRLCHRCARSPRAVRGDLLSGRSFHQYEARCACPPSSCRLSLTPTGLDGYEYESARPPVCPVQPDRCQRASPAPPLNPTSAYGVRGPRSQLLLKGGACAIAAGDATEGSALDGNWPPPG